MDPSAHYVIRRKIVRVEPIPVPETTSHPPPLPARVPLGPLSSNALVDRLAQPKVVPSPDDTLPLIPTYKTDAPEWDPIDLRVTAATLRRDAHLKHVAEHHLAEERTAEPAQYNAWRAAMNAEDEANRVSAIQARHDDLDFVRRRAKKAKKQEIEDRLARGREFRAQNSADLARTKREREAELGSILESKAQHPDVAPAAVARCTRDRRADAKQFRKQLKADLRSARRRREGETEELRKNAERLRHEHMQHTNRHGDTYTSKREITETKFLMALTDEETSELIEKNRSDARQGLETKLQQGRREREERMDELCAILEELQESRDAGNEELKRRRREAQEAEEREVERRRKEEDEKLLKLERKIQKKKAERIEGAKEMDEHMRAIAARNRYLALNKRELQERVFESRQDAALRSAKDRQDAKMPEQPATPVKKKRKKAELVNLKAILGI
jgi:hypothetical protein